MPRVLRIGLVATGEFTRLLVDASGDEDGYAGGFELSLLDLGAIRLGRYGDMVAATRDYNTFGFSIGPPGLRFSYAKTSSEGYTISKRYSLAVVLDEWPRR